MHGQRHRQVERVVGSLVGNDRFVQIHRVLGNVQLGRLQIQRLAHRGDELDFVEHLDQLVVVRLVAKLLLQHVKDGRIEHEGIIDRGQLNIVHLVPAWLATARLAAIHHVVADEEHRLEL